MLCWRPTFPRNLAVIFSKYDEFSGLMWGRPIARNVGKTEKMKNVFGARCDIETGKLYGSVEQGTARKLYTPDMIDSSTIMYWALGVAIVSLILFLLWHFIFNRKSGATGVNYGLTWRGKGLDIIKIRDSGRKR